MPSCVAVLPSGAVGQTLIKVILRSLGCQNIGLNCWNHRMKEVFCLKLKITITTKLIDKIYNSFCTKSEDKIHRYLQLIDAIYQSYL